MICVVCGKEIERFDDIRQTTYEGVIVRMHLSCIKIKRRNQNDT